MDSHYLQLLCLMLKPSHCFSGMSHGKLGHNEIALGLDLLEAPLRHRHATSASFMSPTLPVHQVDDVSATPSLASK